MDTPTSTDNRSLAAANLEQEINNFVKQASSPGLAPQIESIIARQTSSPTLAPQVENNAERIRSTVARLTSNSIEELEGLKTELQKLQEFLSSEVERVQREIESALAGITIIVETIAPWKNTVAPVTRPNVGYAGRSSSAANSNPNRT
jgi:predicted transcriptional regulator